MEFNEYATEVDIEFVRKSVMSIGRCAIKLEEAAERSSLATRPAPSTCPGHEPDRAADQGPKSGA